jgi:hypothetical protein
MRAHPMRPDAALFITLAVVTCAGAAAQAQDDPKPIGPIVLDVRGLLPKFPADQQLADSRALALDELPGRGIGLDAGAHLYLFKWKAITVGVGGQVTLARSRSSALVEDGVTVRRGVTERFVSMTPQLSFNFGTGDGWSYISGGMGKAVWSLVPDGADPRPSDDERLTTINYGGGARWFSTPHLAFTVDVRFHAVYPGTPLFGLAGSPRTTLMMIGVGASMK